MRLIPAIDLHGGRCVRLYQGDFDAETDYAVSADALALRYREFGADWLHVVDLDGAKTGNGVNRELIRSLARDQNLHVQSGGGVRDARAVEELMACGVERVVIGSAAIMNAAEVEEWLEEFGGERIMLAFDVRHDQAGEPRLATHGWQHQSSILLWDAVDRFAVRGLKHVLCTDIHRDGALNGPNVNLYRETVRRYPCIRWQASGGIRNEMDLQALAATGVDAAVSGKALLEQRIAPEELRPYLPNASSPV